MAEDDYVRQGMTQEEARRQTRLARNPGFGVVVIVILAIGIGARIDPMKALRV